MAVQLASLARLSLLPDALARATRSTAVSCRFCAARDPFPSLPSCVATLQVRGGVSQVERRLASHGLKGLLERVSVGKGIALGSLSPLRVLRSLSNLRVLV